MRKVVFISLVIGLISTIVQFGMADSGEPVVTGNQSYFVFSPDNRYLVKVFHSSNTTWVRVHDTDKMKMLTQWQIPNFQAHTTRFSLKEPTKLLIADKKRLLVYRLIDNRKNLLFMQPSVKGQEIVQAYFNKETDDIVWATKRNVYQSNPVKNEQKEILRVPWGEGVINSVTATGKEDLAVNLKNSNRILLLSSENGYQPEELKGHKKTIVGLQSIGKKELVSLDSDYQLIVWNTATKDVQKKLALKKPSEDAKALGFSLDNPEEYLSVVSRNKGEIIGQRYLLSNIKKGRVEPETLPMTITSSGNVYSSVNSFSVKKDEPAPDERRSAASWQPPPKKKKNTLYDLAKIEADYGEYQAALELIKKIPLDDPEYGKSRMLKRQVFDAINDQNIVNAAREQMKKGNYKSARILLEDALAKNPDSKLVSGQLSQVEEKLDDKTWLKVVFILVLALLTTALGYVIWRYKNLPAQNGAGSSRRFTRKAKIFGFGGIKPPVEDENQQLRHKFVYKLDETRRLLNQAATKDTDRRFKNTWMEFTARLNTIEKRAKLSDKFLNDFMGELDKVQQTIEKLSSQGEKKSSFESNEKADPKSEQTREEKTRQQQSDKNTKEPNNHQKTDYYSILGVEKNATLDDIKKAYRQKMKEYHPDRHNSSDFSWVKEEADKRTKLVQEAYRKLSKKLK